MARSVEVEVTTDGAAEDQFAAVALGILLCSEKSDCRDEKYKDMKDVSRV